MIHNIFLWVLPLLLVAFEALMRTATSVDVSDFIGPALAGASTTMIAPLTKAPTGEYVSETGETLLTMRKFDENFSHGCILLMILFILLWMGSMFIAASHAAAAGSAANTGQAFVAPYSFFGFPAHTFVGYAVYAFCIFVLVWRERTR